MWPSETSSTSVLHSCRELYAEARAVIHGNRTFIFQDPHVLWRLNERQPTASQQQMLQGMRFVTFRLPFGILDPADRGFSYRHLEHSEPRSPKDIMGDTVFLLKQWQALLKSDVMASPDGRLRKITYEIDFLDVPFDLLDNARWTRFKAVIHGLLLVFLRYDINTGSLASEIKYTNLSPEFQRLKEHFHQHGRLPMPQDNKCPPVFADTKTMHDIQYFWYCKMRIHGLLSADSHARAPFTGERGTDLAQPDRGKKHRDYLRTYRWQTEYTNATADHEKHERCIEELVHVAKESDHEDLLFDRECMDETCEDEECMDTEHRDDFSIGDQVDDEFVERHEDLAMWEMNGGEDHYDAWPDDFEDMSKPDEADLY